MVEKQRKSKTRINNLENISTLMIDALMEYAPDGIYFKDLKSRFIRINKAGAKKSLGLNNPEEAVGRTDFDFFSKEHAEKAFRDEQQIIKTGKPLVNIEEKETWKGRECRWISTTKMPFYDKEGNIVGTFGISRDITDRKKAEEKIRYLSFHDILTGLYNRAYFEEELKRLDTERQLPLTIVMGDIDGLKTVNDTHGHFKGDLCLKRIADILKEAFRKEDIISRWGGDEFITILPRTSSADAEKIVKRIQSLCKKGSIAEIPLSISFGISTKKSPKESANSVIKKAESRMYENKKNRLA